MCIHSIYIASAKQRSYNVAEYYVTPGADVDCSVLTKVRGCIFDELEVVRKFRVRYIFYFFYC